MTVLHLNASDVDGGAARSTYRLHRGLLRQGVDSRVLVQWKAGDDPLVEAPSSAMGFAMARVRPRIVAPLIRLGAPGNTPLRSINLLRSGLARRINASGADVVHLHWVHGEMLSIADIGRIRKPLVWTLHDMWAFAGAEHCVRATDAMRPRAGYTRETRSKNARGFDIDRWTWNRKVRHWRNLEATLIAPSNWMAGEARASVLFRDARIHVLHNGIDLNAFKPADRTAARRAFSLPSHKKLILFGAVDATSDPNKGFFRLEPALQRLAGSESGRDAELVVFGATAPERPPDFGMRAHYVGRLHDDVSLALLYAAADVFVAPSTVDNLPNTVLEALACGTPCVAFNVGGMPDLIEDRRTGYLARPYETDDLAHGIEWVLEDADRHRRLATWSRVKAETTFSVSAQARAMSALYEEMLHVPPSDRSARPVRVRMPDAVSS